MVHPSVLPRRESGSAISATWGAAGRREQCVTDVSRLVEWDPLLPLLLEGGSHSVRLLASVVPLRSPSRVPPTTRLQNSGSCPQPADNQSILKALRLKKLPSRERQLSDIRNQLDQLEMRIAKQKAHMTRLKEQWEGSQEKCLHLGTQKGELDIRPKAKAARSIFQIGSMPGP